MKRLIGAIAAGVGVFGMVLGLAASLSVTSDSLGAGTSVVAACQSGAFNVQYAPAYASSVPGYATTTATVTGLTAACYSMPYRITLYGSGGTSLGEATGTTPASGTSFSPVFTAVSDNAVTGVALVISTH